MPQIVQFEGAQHQFPDDFSQAEIQQALSSLPRSSTAATPQAAAPKFIPVDHDPFAAGPKLIPVDHDPFAGAPSPPISGPQSVPADIIRGAGGAPTKVVMYPTERINRPASVLPSSVSGAVRDFTVGAQGVGKGISHIATGPFDLVAGAQNAVTAGINKVFGTNIPSATPASKIVERGADKLNLPFIDPATMSNSEKLAYDMSDYGTQALAVGSALATRAPEVLAQTTRAPTLARRTLDTMARPYKDAPARTTSGQYERTNPEGHRRLLSRSCRAWRSLRGPIAQGRSSR